MADLGLRDKQVPEEAQAALHKAVHTLGTEAGEAGHSDKVRPAQPVTWPGGRALPRSAGRCLGNHRIGH